MFVLGDEEMSNILGRNCRRVICFILFSTKYPNIGAKSNMANPHPILLGLYI